MLATYEDKLEQITREVVKNLGYLIAGGLIEEQKNSDGNLNYQIAGKPEKVFDLLDKLDDDC
ncbi:MAG TPA: hypothetical protein VKA68_05585 [bacterium]|nr:hypothetical protein [bacterium]